eukprot:1148631-Pelagomonas_calceolata.AAC.8
MLMWAAHLTDKSGTSQDRSNCQIVSCHGAFQFQNSSGIPVLRDSGCIILFLPLHPQPICPFQALNAPGLTRAAARCPVNGQLVAAAAHRPVSGVALAAAAHCPMNGHTVAAARCPVVVFTVIAARCHLNGYIFAAPAH